jgi:hypothetical protein
MISRCPGAIPVFRAYPTAQPGAPLDDRPCLPPPPTVMERARSGGSLPPTRHVPPPWRARRERGRPGAVTEAEVKQERGRRIQARRRRRIAPP